ncbi:MAG: NADH-quinone oxidoreductase subunit C, partial [Nitrosospira sp.]
MSSSRLETLSFCLQNLLAAKLVSSGERLGELTIAVSAADALGVMETLRDHVDLRFEILIDLCGMDYSTYGVESASRNDLRGGKRFAAVYHLLSINHNHRLRIKVFA